MERQRSIFTEVDAIGRDFETVVVDFLGFSTAKNRDTTSAPKDSALGGGGGGGQGFPKRSCASLDSLLSLPVFFIPLFSSFGNS